MSNTTSRRNTRRLLDGLSFHRPHSDYRLHSTAVVVSGNDIVRGEGPVSRSVVWMARSSDWQTPCGTIARLAFQPTGVEIVNQCSSLSRITPRHMFGRVQNHRVSAMQPRTAGFQSCGPTPGMQRQGEVRLQKKANGQVKGAGYCSSE